MQLTLDDMVGRLGVLATAAMLSGQDDMAKPGDWVIWEPGCKGLPYWIGWRRLPTAHDAGIQDWADEPTEAGRYITAAHAWRVIEAHPAVFAGCEPRTLAEVLRG